MAIPNPVEPTFYEVRAGDSLWAIAEHFYGHGDEWHVLFAVNNQIGDNPNLIHPGTSLVIPGRYVVQPGDTWESIHKRYTFITLRQDLQRIPEEGPVHVTPGEILYLESGGGGIGDHE